jgi:hypothetical protein
MLPQKHYMPVHWDAMDSSMSCCIDAVKNVNTKATNFVRTPSGDTACLNSVCRKCGSLWFAYAGKEVPSAPFWGDLRKAFRWIVR